MQNELSHPCAPWWRHGHVWLVISGPAVVLVAGLVTTWIAVHSPDPVLSEHQNRQVPRVAGTLAKDRGLVPAIQGRNHAATPAPAGAR